jgi:hypothetical protein
VLSIRIVIVAMVALIGILCLTGVVYQDCDCYHGSFDWYSMFARCFVNQDCDYCLGNYNWYFVFDCCCLSWL